MRHAATFNELIFHNSTSKDTWVIHVAPVLRTMSTATKHKHKQKLQSHNVHSWPEHDQVV